MKTIIITETQKRRIFEDTSYSSIVTFYRGVGGEFDLTDFGVGKKYGCIWLADSPEYAAEYAAEYGDEGHLYAVDVDLSRYNPYDWYYEADSYFDPYDGFSSEVIKELMNDGYNGYNFPLDECEVTVLFDPSLIVGVSELPLQEYLEECKKPLVTEAADDSFSLAELSKIGSTYGKLRYCREHIGLPEGQGSSRDTYQLDDEKVLKVARNPKGMAQNAEEGRDFYKRGCKVFPMVFDAAEDGSWLVSEYVLPATDEDFQHVFGMPFKTFCSYVAAASANYDEAIKRRFSCASRDMYIDFLNSNGNFRDVDQYIQDYNPPPGDLVALENYGLALRDCKPYIVLLDSGFSYEIWNKYYKPK